MTPTHTTAPRSRQRLASSALFREAFASLSDAWRTLLDALYTFFVLDAPAWINRQDDRFCAFLFADEPWELRPPATTPTPSDNRSWWNRVRERWAKRKRLIWHSKPRNVYSKPSYVPAHFYDEDGRWDAVPNWIGWAALVVCLFVSAWLFYLWPELMIGIVALVSVVLLCLIFRKP